MFYKLRTHDSHPQGKIFAWMAFMVAMAICIASPIMPNFIKTILHSDSAVSFFYSFLAVAVLIGSLGSSIIFRKIEKTTILKSALLFLALITFLLIFVTKFVSMTVLVTLKVWMEMLLQISIALFVRDFAKANNLGKEEGLRFKFQNIGALTGLMLGGFLASQMNYEFVFLAESLIVLSAFAFFYKKHVVDKHQALSHQHKPEKLFFFKNLKEFFANPERAKIYFIGMAHMLWITFKYLYIPLYVANSGYLSSMSGLILSIAMVPVIIFETKTGEFAEIWGIKKIITIGFLFIGILLTFIFLSPWPLLNFGLLAVANTGGAFIEPLRETYLLKNIPREKEEQLYGIYGTADPVASFLTPAIGAATLAFLPFKFVFIIFGTIMLIAAYFSWTSLKRS